MAGTSRIDFTPAETTRIGTPASATRSADSSKVVAGPAVHAAEPARREDADPGPVGEQAVAATVVPPSAPRAAATGRSRTLIFATSGVSARRASSARDRPDGTPARDPDRRRHHAGVAEQLLGLERRREVARAREPVGDDRGLEGDDRPTGGDRVPDLVGDEHGGGWCHLASVACRVAVNDCSPDQPMVPPSSARRYGA